MGSASCFPQEPRTADETVIVHSVLDRVREMLPRSVADCLEKVPDDVQLTTRINPFYLRGDFDGDARMDHAFLIERSGLDGFALCLAGDPQPTWLGAGKEFHELTSLDFDDWSVYPKGPVLHGVGESDPPTLQSDALFLLWSERASTLVYWTGNDFSWYQQGD